jgi:hypothetical protein
VQPAWALGPWIGSSSRPNDESNWAEPGTFWITISIHFEQRMSLNEFTNRFDDGDSEKHTNVFVNHIQFFANLWPPMKMDSAWIIGAPKLFWQKVHFGSVSRTDELIVANSLRP